VREDFRQLRSKLKFLVIRNVLAPFSGRLGIDRAVETAVDLAEIEKFRQELQLVDFELLEIRGIKRSVPIGITRIPKCR